MDLFLVTRIQHNHLFPYNYIMQNLFKKLYGFTVSCKVTDATYIDLNIRNTPSLFESHYIRNNFRSAIKDGIFYMLLPTALAMSISKPNCLIKFKAVITYNWVFHHDQKLLGVLSNMMWYKYLFS